MTLRALLSLCEQEHRRRGLRQRCCPLPFPPAARVRGAPGPWRPRAAPLPPCSATHTHRAHVYEACYTLLTSLLFCSLRSPGTMPPRPQPTAAAAGAVVSGTTTADARAAAVRMLEAQKAREAEAVRQKAAAKQQKRATAKQAVESAPKPGSLKRAATPVLGSPGSPAGKQQTGGAEREVGTPGRRALFQM